MTPAGRQIWQNQDKYLQKKIIDRVFVIFFLTSVALPIAAWENTFGFVLFPAIGAVVWTAPFY